MVKRCEIPKNSPLASFSHHLWRGAVMAVQHLQVRMRSSWTLMAWEWLMESAAWSGEPSVGRSENSHSPLSGEIT